MKGHAPDQGLPPQPSRRSWRLSLRVRGALRRGSGVAALFGIILLAWRYPFAVSAAAALAFVLFMHELGHYVTARAVGMKVTDFFLGFGPRLWGFRRGETAYGLRVLPLGAYVRIIGMARNDPVDPGDEDRAYRVKSYPRRALVVSAGSLMHFAMAFAAFLAMHSFLGAPSLHWQVAEVTDSRDGVELPAASAGIIAGDRVVAVNDRPTPDWETFVAEVQAHPNQNVDLVIERGERRVITPVTLAADPDTGRGLLGVRAEHAVRHETASPPAALWRAAGDLGGATVDSVSGLWLLVANFGDVADRVVSPPGDPSANAELETRPLSVVGIVHLAADASLGWPERALLFAYVNVFLGVFNMVPLPPFDGGLLAIATYERWRERRGGDRYLSDPKALMPVIAVVVTALALLAIGLLYLDIANPIDL